MAGWRPPLLGGRMSDIGALLTNDCTTILKAKQDHNDEEACSTVDATSPAWC